MRMGSRQGVTYAPSGVYSMVGAAAMLAGFKQMCLAVCVFIVACANDIDMYPPLMLCVVVSLVLNRSINTRGFDEEQILRKGIDFLPHDMPACMNEETAADLLDPVPEGGEATLYENATLEEVCEVLERCEDAPEIAVVEGTGIGFARREALEAAVDALRKKDASEYQEVLVQRLVERPPYIVLEEMSAPRVYTLFAKSGARVVVVVDENGNYKGRITRHGLILGTRRREQAEDAGEPIQRQTSGALDITSDTP